MARCHYRAVLLGLVAVPIGIVVASQSGLAQTVPAPPAPAQTPTPQAAPAPTQQAPPPATQSLSAAELEKIKGFLTGQGRDIAITPIITDILGLTDGNQTLTCRAFAAEGAGDEIHQVYALPDGKGYLEAHFYKDKLDVYWTDKDFALLAAVEGIRGQKPAPASFADAQYGFGFESAWWAKYADGH